MTGGDLKIFELLQDLADAERDDLAELLEERDLSNGETLFDAGDEADALILVATGSLSLAGQDGRASLTLEAGDWLGGLSLLSVGTRAGSAVGLQESELWLLRRDAFLRFAEDHPRGAFRVAAALGATTAQHARAALDASALGSVDPRERSD